MTYPPYGDPKDPYAQQPYGQQPYGYSQPQYPQPYGNPYFPPPEHPQATTILILGILSICVCQLTGPFAWSMGNKALKEIDAAGGAIGGRGNVKAGYICGIVGSVMLIGYLLLFVIWIIFFIGIIGASSTSSY